LLRVPDELRQLPSDRGIDMEANMRGNTNRSLVRNGSSLCRHSKHAWRGVLWVVLALAAVSSASLTAQVPGTTPAGRNSIEGSPTIDRDRLDRNEPTLPNPAHQVPVPRSTVSIASAPTVGAEPSTLKRVRFQGSTLDPRQLVGAARPFAGAPLTRETLQKLADAVTAVYAKSDIAFYAVSIVPRTLDGGVLTVQVVEGRVANYTLAKRTSSTPERLISAQLRPLLTDKPAHRSRIERTLSLLRDVPGQTVTANLRRTEKPDELVLDLDVKRKQVEMTLNVNNRGVVNVISGVQAQADLALNGVLREGDSTRLSTYLPLQPSRYQFYSASHSTPLDASGTTLGVSGAYVRTRTREPEVRGEAKQFAVVIAHPLIRSYERNLTARASMDGTNSDNYFLDTAFGGFRTRTLRLGANWSVQGKLSGYALSGSLSQGLDALGARNSVGYSETSFRKANIQGVAVKQLSKRMTIKAGVRGQYSKDRLPTTERFALGGEGAGLAFRYGVLTADMAASADIEMSYRLLGAPASSQGVTAFVYADGATARSYSRPVYALRSSNFSLASAGGGLRVSPLKGWSASAQVAVPVKATASGIGRKTRFFFSISRTV
jgi:hemolysin activation/secretion protein